MFSLAGSGHRRRRRRHPKLIALGVIVAVAVIALVYAGRTKHTTELAATQPAPATNMPVISNSQPSGHVVSNTPTSSSTSNAPVSVPPAAPTITTSSISGVDGITIDKTADWQYVTITDHSKPVIQIGTKVFPLDNPYRCDLPDDGFGYIASIDSLPSEAIGPQTATATVTTQAGPAQKSTYVGVMADGVTTCTQSIYTLEHGGLQYVAVFTTQTKNADLPDRFETLVHTLRF